MFSIVPCTSLVNQLKLELICCFNITGMDMHLYKWLQKSRDSYLLILWTSLEISTYGNNCWKTHKWGIWDTITQGTHEWVDLRYKYTRLVFLYLKSTHSHMCFLTLKCLHKKSAVDMQSLFYVRGWMKGTDCWIYCRPLWVLTSTMTTDGRHACYNFTTHQKPCEY